MQRHRPHVRNLGTNRKMPVSSINTKQYGLVFLVFEMIKLLMVPWAPAPIIIPNNLTVNGLHRNSLCSVSLSVSVSVSISFCAFLFS